jgi:hypothetical protein
MLRHHVPRRTIRHVSNFFAYEGEHHDDYNGTSKHRGEGR